MDLTKTEWKLILCVLKKVNKDAITGTWYGNKLPNIIQKIEANETA